MSLRIRSIGCLVHGPSDPEHPGSDRVSIRVGIQGGGVTDRSGIPPLAEYAPRRRVYSLRPLYLCDSDFPVAGSR